MIEFLEKFILVFKEKESPRKDGRISYNDVSEN